MGDMVNNRLIGFKKKCLGRRIAVLGIGISNTPLLRYLCGLGADVTAFDSSEREELSQRLNQLDGLDIKYHLGKEYLKHLKGFNIIFKTPVIRPDIPQLVEESKRGAYITSEMEVFLNLCPAQVFGVTGSDGKTTTASLIFEILKAQGYRCWLGGNIGNPLLGSIDKILPDHKVVLELSSFQLMTMRTSPDIAVVTNISPNHLDVHTSMQEYVDAKRNIYRYQKSQDTLVLNFDNSITREFAEEAFSNVIFSSRKKELKKGAFVKGKKLVFRDEKDLREITDVSRVRLPGEHNIENLLAAISATARYVEDESIREVSENFRGVEHRIEPVRKINEIRFYNDSIASSPNRTIAGLKSFRQKVILIAGGKDKNCDYSKLGRAIHERVKLLVITGQTAEKIERSYYNWIEKNGQNKSIQIYRCDDMEDAVATAYLNAQPGDIVLLSPASTSFDMYRNFEERGNHFKELVRMLN